MNIFFALLNSCSFPVRRLLTNFFDFPVQQINFEEIFFENLLFVGGATVFHLITCSPDVSPCWPIWTVLDRSKLEQENETPSWLLVKWWRMWCCLDGVQFCIVKLLIYSWLCSSTVGMHQIRQGTTPVANSILLVIAKCFWRTKVCVATNSWCNVLYCGFGFLGTPSLKVFFWSINSSLFFFLRQGKCVCGRMTSE